MLTSVTGSISSFLFGGSNGALILKVVHRPYGLADLCVGCDKAMMVIGQGEET